MSTFATKLAVTASGAALLLGAVSANAWAAPETNAAASCPPGANNTCWWGHNDYKGGKDSMSTTTETCFDLVPGKRSVINESKYELWIYGERGCKGGVERIMPAGAREPALGFGALSFKLIPY